MKEAKITINGFEVSETASMIIRVAITSMIIDLHENGLGEDETGKKLSEAYLVGLRSIEKMLTS